MGYDWDDKRDVCYRLYVEERKPLEEVVDYFRDKLEFVPSKRTFQTQFRRWGFPTKMDYSHKDEAVVERVREMWERNVMQKDMLPVLHAEGFNVTESGLTRLRAKHNMHLKSSNGVRAGMEGGVGRGDESTLSIGPTGDFISGDGQIITPISQPRERVRKRKRPPETGLAASGDTSGAPRYPSETTIGDAQKFLGLTEDMYRDVRDRFRAICDERGIVKKTICGPERWEEAKNALVQGDPYLQQLFMRSDTPSQQPLTLSLDIVCMDVTKLIRVQSKTMSLGEAKNTLGLNPLEARVLKTKLIDILRANNFVNTYESDNWQGLKEQWLEGTHLKARIPPEEGPERDKFMKAMQLVCRDTLKRWREAQRLAREKAAKDGTAASTDLVNMPSSGPSPAPKQQKAPAKAARRPRESGGASENSGQEARIDPSLLQAATTSGTETAIQGMGTYPLPDAADLALEPPLAVYFRRSPQTSDIGVPQVWLGVLATRSLAGLHQAALEFPGGGAFSVLRMQGASTSAAGQELLYQIDQDDELQGYLLHSEGSKAAFVVQLARRM